jgi:hypothetical protein
MNRGRPKEGTRQVWRLLQFYKKKELSVKAIRAEIFSKICVQTPYCARNQLGSRTLIESYIDRLYINHM